MHRNVNSFPTMSWLPFLARQRAGSPVTGESAALSLTARPNGYEHRTGQVTWISAKTRHRLHLRISGLDQIVELGCSQYWVIERNDVLDLLGRPDPDSGKFIAGAYYNRTQRILDAAYRHLARDKPPFPGLFVGALLVGAGAFFVTATVYLPLLFLGPFTLGWLAIWFSVERKFRESRREKEAKLAWNDAVAAFRQNVRGRDEDKIDDGFAGRGLPDGGMRDGAGPLPRSQP